MKLFYSFRKNSLKTSVCLSFCDLLLFLVFPVPCIFTFLNSVVIYSACANICRNDKDNEEATIMMADLAFRQTGSSRSMHVITDRLFLFSFKNEELEQSEPVLILIPSLLCCVFAKDD